MIHHRLGALAEKIFMRGADDARSGLQHGAVTISANYDYWNAFGFAHEQTGSGGKFIGDRKNGGLQRFGVAIRRAAQIEEHGNAGGADSNIEQAKAPGATKGVADNHGNLLAGLF